MPSFSLMPHSQTILRAMAVAILMSPAAPVVTSPKTISSATRPPIFTARLASNSFLRLVYLSSSGNHMVDPSDGPRGMMVTLWSGSVCGDRKSVVEGKSVGVDRGGVLGRRDYRR